MSLISILPYYTTIISKFGINLINITFKKKDEQN